MTIEVILAGTGAVNPPGKHEVQGQSSAKPRPGPGYLAGTFPDGITSVLGSPEPATIRVLYRPAGGALGDGMVVAEVQSEANGTWRVDGLDPSLRFDVVCRKEGYNDLIWCQVQPTTYPPITLSGAFTPDTVGFTLQGSLMIAGRRGDAYVEVSGAAPPGITFQVAGDTVSAVGRCLVNGAYSWTLTVVDGVGNRGSIVCSATLADLWTPDKLATPPKLWVDDLSSFSLNGSAVAQWGDRSGNDWGLAQAAAGRQPTLILNGLNGLPVVRFDGSDDILGTSAVAARDLFRNIAKGWVFSVVKRRGAGASTSVLFASPRDTSPGSGMRFGVYDTLAATSRPGVGGRRVSADAFGSFTSAKTMQDSWYIRLDLLEYDTRTATLWLDGSQDGQSTGLWSAAGNSDDLASGAPLSLGGAYTGSGFSAELFSSSDVAALLAGQGVPSSAEISKLFGWAAWYFGLTARLPAGHPYKTVKPTL